MIRKRIFQVLKIIFVLIVTQLSQLISLNKAWINVAWDAIHSLTLHFIIDVISADNVKMCSTNRAIRLRSALVRSMSWISSQNMKNNSPYVFWSFWFLRIHSRIINSSARINLSARRPYEVRKQGKRDAIKHENVVKSEK